MKATPRRSARPARLAAAISRDDPFGMEIERGPGFGRVIFVFLLLHAVGIGGFAAYKWLNPDAPAVVTDSPGQTAGKGASGAAKTGGKLDVDELLASRRVTGTSMSVPHPEMPGYMRYRVGEGESLVEIVRQFHASVAEVEQLNGIKPGTPLFTGQWLTIPDNREPSLISTNGTEAIRPKAIEEGKTKTTPPPQPKPLPQPNKTKVVEADSKDAGKALPDPVKPKDKEADQTQPTPPPAAVKVYRVQRGDTAYSIAKRHNVDWKELLRANGLSDPRQLRADQILRLP